MKKIHDKIGGADTTFHITYNDKDSDSGTNNDIMEIDVNKMPLGQLRELEKYVEECRGNTEEFLTETPINNTQKTNCELNKEKELFEELSESLSSDDDDDSSDMLD